MQAIDTPESTLGKVHDIVNAGYHGFLRYISPNTANFPQKQLTGAEASSILSVAGTGIGMVFEDNPTAIEYFQPGRGSQDAATAIANAGAAGAPSSTPIFYAVDYDATDVEIQGAILDYFTEVHAAMSAQGLLTGIYGSGDACSAMLAAGVVHHTWLAQSTGWGGYEDWKGSADIVQGPGMTVGGLDVDTDEVVNGGVLWGDA